MLSHWHIVDCFSGNEPNEQIECQAKGCRVCGTIYPNPQCLCGNKNANLTKQMLKAEVLFCKSMTTIIVYGLSLRFSGRRKDAANEAKHRLHQTLLTNDCQ